MSRRCVPSIRPNAGKSPGSMWVIEGMRGANGRRIRKFFPTQESARDWMDQNIPPQSGFAMRVYPDVPAPMWIHSKAALSLLPEGPHIYFVWDANGEVGYVGQTIKLKSRIASHPYATNGRSVSFVPCAAEDLYYAESYYIALCRPAWNFGKMKRTKHGYNHVQKKTPEERAELDAIMARSEERWNRLEALEERLALAPQ